LGLPAVGCCEYSVQRPEVRGRTRRQELLPSLFVELWRLAEIEIQIECRVDQRARSLADSGDRRSQQRFVRVLDAAQSEEWFDPRDVVVERGEPLLFELLEGHVGE